jgi:hypothetical protein
VSLASRCALDPVKGVSLDAGSPSCSTIERPQD